MPTCSKLLEPNQYSVPSNCFGWYVLRGVLWCFPKWSYLRSTSPNFDNICSVERNSICLCWKWSLTIRRKSINSSNPNSLGEKLQSLDYCTQCYWSSSYRRIRFRYLQMESCLSCWCWNSCSTRRSANSRMKVILI